MANPANLPTVAQRFLRFINRGEIITYGGVALLLLFIAGAIAVYLLKFLFTSVGQPFFSILIPVNPCACPSLEPTKFHILSDAHAREQTSPLS